ncbi:MAG TPA: endolytic transglycosylase MltG [Edaphocola sp.]|nr:endolytic transglycosylase MltG [Edaphocola sp.]
MFRFSNIKLVISIAFFFLFMVSCKDTDNVKAEAKLHIPTGASFSQIMDSINPILKDPKSFESFAKSKGMEKKFYSGRYTLKPGMKNSEIVMMIQEGNQDEIAIRIGNYSSVLELSGKMGNILESDSFQILDRIVNASFADGIDTAKLLSFYLPNTNNFHWNTSGDQFVERMYKEYQKFWSPKRLQEAEQAKMTPLEVTTLASIVQLESAKPDEQAKVAALYLNRLRIGMKLDADPTIVFIKKMNNGFQTKVSRVYYKDLAIVSPYNTYLNRGLPPGPICMPNPSAIDAVLNPETHDYIYFVADTSRPGYHLFAKTLSEQEVNAKAYRAWANKNNVR